MSSIRVYRSAQEFSYRRLGFPLLILHVLILQ